MPCWCRTLSEPTPFTDGQHLVLRPTRESDLDTVLALESHADNSPFIGSWTREEHAGALNRERIEHFVVTAAEGQSPIGYLIALNLVVEGFGVLIKRIVVGLKSRGLGRAFLSSYLVDALPRLGAHSAMLSVMRTNRRAQSMYRSIGFAEVTLPPEDLTKLVLDPLVGKIDESFIIMRAESTALTSPGREVSDGE